MCRTPLPSGAMLPQRPVQRQTRRHLVRRWLQRLRNGERRQDGNGGQGNTAIKVSHDLAPLCVDDTPRRAAGGFVVLGKSLIVSPPAMAVGGKSRPVASTAGRGASDNSRFSGKIPLNYPGV